MRFSPAEFVEWTVYSTLFVILIQAALIAAMVVLRRAASNAPDPERKEEFEDAARGIEAKVPLLWLLRALRDVTLAGAPEGDRARTGRVSVALLSIAVGAAVAIAGRALSPPSPAPPLTPLILAFACVHLALAIGWRKRSCLGVIGAYTGVVAVVLGLGIVETGWVLIGIGWTAIGLGMFVGGISILSGQRLGFGVGTVAIGVGMVAHGSGEVVVLGATTGCAYIATGMFVLAAGAFSLGFGKAFAAVACLGLAIGLGASAVTPPGIRELPLAMLIGGTLSAAWAGVMLLKPNVDLRLTSFVCGTLMVLGGVPLVLVGRTASGFGLLTLALGAYTSTAAILLPDDPLSGPPSRLESGCRATISNKDLDQLEIDP